MRPTSTRCTSNIAHADARRAVSRRTGSVPAALESEAQRASAWNGAASAAGISGARSGSPEARRLGAQKATRSRAASAAAGAASYGGRYIANTIGAEVDATGTGMSEETGFSSSEGLPGSRPGSPVPGATPSATLGASAALATKIATVPASPLVGSASKTLKRAQKVELDILMKRHPGSIKKDPALVRKLKSHRKMVLRRKRRAALKQATLAQKAGRKIGSKVSARLFKGRKGRLRFLSLRRTKHKMALATSMLSLGGVLLLGAILASSIGLIQFSHQSSDSSSNGGSLEGNELKIFQYLTAHGCDDVHAAAIMGNFAAESGIDPRGDQAYGYPYWDNGISPHSNAEVLGRGMSGGVAVGLGQWDRGRRYNLVKFAESKGASWYDLDTQLEFWAEHDEWPEGSGTKFTSADGLHNYDTFMAAADIEGATMEYVLGWERCAMVGGKPSAWDYRLSSAKRILAAARSGTLGGGGGQGLSGATGSQLAVVSACNSTPSPGLNWCAAWVTNVFRNAGVGYFGGNACDMVRAYCHSNNRSDLKVGMIVGDASHPGTGQPGLLYGHIGIYVGDGKVMSNEGSITTKTLDEFIGFYGKGSGVYWGWMGGIELK